MNLSRYGFVLAGLGIFIGMLVLFGSWYTIDQTQRGVLLRNGAYVETVQPGLRFKWPLIEQVYKIDMQTHTKTYGVDPKSGASVMEAYSADQQPAHLRVSVTLRIAPDKAKAMYERFGGDYEAAVQRIIAPHVFERVKVVFGQYTAQRAITARGQLNADTARAIADAISYDPVFLIESAQIENISFSSEYIKSVEQRMQAEVEVARFRQQLEREKVQATIKVTQAQAQADSTLAVAKAEAEAITLRGAAEATAINARGKALAENSQLVSLVQAERWDGKLPVTMLPGGAVPMLNLAR